MIPLSERQKMVRTESELSVRLQCRILGISRSNLYYENKGESALNLELMRLMDEHYYEHPSHLYTFYKCLIMSNLVIFADSLRLNKSNLARRTIHISPNSLIIYGIIRAYEAIYEFDQGS